MKPEIKKLWIGRLRSGEIPQGFGVLARDSHRCCLGVLCDIAVEQGILTRVEEDNGLFSYDDNTQILPQSVVDWSGLDEYNPAITLPGVSEDEETLAYANDNGHTFEQIADIIEAKF